MTLGVAAEEYLEDLDFRVLPWTKPQGGPSALETIKVLFGGGESPFEAAFAKCLTGAPRNDDVRRLWKLRHNNRSSPVLLIVLYEVADGVHASLCGATGDPTVLADVPLDRAGRICTAALSEPDRHAALRTLDRLLIGARDQLTAGLVNQGLFATHELREGVPRRIDWEPARAGARPLLPLRGLALIQALGYGTVSRGSAALLLTDGGASRAIAILLDESEVFERPTARHGAVSPVAHAIALAARENLPWVIVLRDSQIRLYPSRPNVGVGRKSQGETYTGLDLALLSDADAGYLSLLFAPNALVSGGTADEILAASANFATDLGSRLRERVYRDVVPGLAVAVAKRMNANTEADLNEAYHRTLMILFRLLFLAYAEDRGLLPYGRNPRYDRHAIKTLAKDFAADLTQEFDPAATALWDGMATVWTAVDEGNRGWDVPAYNGGLFSRDPQRSPSGAALADLRLTDAEFGPALRALLVDAGTDGTRGPVDFRSLSVREFGTIYEGLLESSLSVAPTDLAVDTNSTFVPAQDGGNVEVPAGQIYFHNRSGSRKSTGSYFTKSFAVEHLLDSALEPALTNHLAQVEHSLASGDEAAATDRFFDFRVADLSMGSGHFLVAAIDRIEARFTSFLSEHPIPAIADELGRLAQSAHDALGDQANNLEIEASTLLRRQIARRCIYGIDLNLIAVELARLAIWIHTFVPGLPMSSLDHGLVQGNSLTGIGTIDEVLEILDPNAGPGTVSLFEDSIHETLVTAKEQLTRVAGTAEATAHEVREAAKAHAQALEEARDAKALFDAATAIRSGLLTSVVTAEDAIAAGHLDDIRSKIDELRAIHFPHRFPEVFLRDRPGFDVLLGNPPWEKVKVEEHQWWTLRFPGLRSMSQKDKNEAIATYRRDRPDLVVEYDAEVAAVAKVKNVLAKGPYPGLRAATDTDLSLAFAWRFWQLLRSEGRSGVVLPRTILSGTAGAQLRQAMLEGGEFSDVTMLTNNRGWLFDIHPQYTIGLITAAKTLDSVNVSLRGPYASRSEYDTGMRQGVHAIPGEDFLTWSQGAAFPLLPDAEGLGVFLQLRSHPRLDSSDVNWQFIPNRELHTTDDKRLFDFDLTRSDGKLPVLAGASFGLWNPDFGPPYAHIVRENFVNWALARRRRQVKLARSAFAGMSPAWAANPDTLDFRRPRIAFRDVARATDSRTLICALVPGSTTLVHLSPYLFRKRGDESDEAFLLGVLSSIPVDWYSRRYAELHMTYELVNSLPIPRPALTDSRRLRVIEIAGALAAVDARFDDWAATVGVAVGSVTTASHKDDLLAELDALVALLFGLDRPGVEHLFATFHRGWAYEDRLAKVLTYYDRWVEQTA